MRSIAGARRYRAAIAAKLETLPVRIVHLTDAQALEIQVIENLQREDVHPLEEAEGFRKLLAFDGYTPELLAEKLGRGVGYIYKRLQLAKLIEPLKGKFLAGEITIAHAVLLAPLSEASQIKAAKEGLFERGWQSNKKEIVSARELAGWIREEIYLDLHAAPWKKDDASLFPSAGACNVCPKRSGANAQLFDEVPKGDVCLEAVCYQAKRSAHLVLIEKTSIAAGETLLKVATELLSPAEEKKLGILSRGNYVKVEGKRKCVHAEKALVTRGNSEVGHVILICRQRTCKTHHPYSYSLSRPAAPSFADVWKEKRKRLDEVIKTEAHREAVRQVQAGIKKLLPEDLRTLASTLIKDYLRHDGRKEFAAVLKLEKEGDLEAALLAAIPQGDAIAGFLLAICCISTFGTSWGGDACSAIAKRARVNVAAIEKRIGKPLFAKLEKQKAAAKKKIAEKRRRNQSLWPQGSDDPAA